MNVLRIDRVIPGVALLCLFTSCGNKSEKQFAADMAADTVSYAYDPDTSKLPDTRLMVRQAEMNFKVKELQKTSQKISEITASCGGEVWNSQLQTEIQNTITKKITTDSLLEVITYRQTNELTIKVPSKNLDSLLVKLEALSQLLHFKKVTTENVSLDYLSHELKSKNMARTQSRHENRLDMKKSNLEQYTAAEYFNNDMQNAVIDHQVQNLALMDKVNFSTVKISIYQDTEAYKNIVANFNSDRFEPAFGSSIIMAVQDGWAFMLGSIIFFVRIWPLYLFGIAVFFLIRFFEKYRLTRILKVK
jgi:hypothetical protein